MAIISIPPRGIQPNKPRTAWLSGGSLDNVYQTALDVTNGRGVITAIYGTTYISNDYYITETRFRITIDGIESIITGTYPEMTATMPSSKAERQVLLTMPLFFYRSAKVEITNYIRAYNAYCTIQYALE